MLARAIPMRLPTPSTTASCANACCGLLAEHRLQLLEAFAEQIATILIGEFGASWVRVRVAKPRKFDDLQAVGVQIERWAPESDGSAGRAQRAAAVLHLIGSGMVPGGR